MQKIEHEETCTFVTSTQEFEYAAIKFIKDSIDHSPMPNKSFQLETGGSSVRKSFRFNI